MTPAQQFFYEHAGWGYNPAIETEEQGRRRGAADLALAEDQAKERGWCCRWEIDPEITSEDFSNDPEPWELWCCTLLDDNGEMIEHLGGIDFGRDGDPWHDHYRRVVEAELAHQHIEEEEIAA